jgi:hypothetical protein
MEVMKYIINDKTYIQKPLVLGQIGILMKVAEGRVINDLSALGLIQAFGDILPKVMAVILIPEGSKVSARDLAALEEEFTNELEIDTALEVTADFLSCNPVSSLFTKLRKIVATFKEKIGETATGSKMS